MRLVILFLLSQTQASLIKQIIFNSYGYRTIRERSQNKNKHLPTLTCQNNLSMRNLKNYHHTDTAGIHVPCINHWKGVVAFYFSASSAGGKNYASFVYLLVFMHYILYFAGTKVTSSQSIRSVHAQLGGSTATITICSSLLQKGTAVGHQSR